MEDQKKQFYEYVDVVGEGMMIDIGAEIDIDGELTITRKEFYRMQYDLIRLTSANESLEILVNKLREELQELNERWCTRMTDQEREVARCYAKIEPILNGKTVNVTSKVSRLLMINAMLTDMKIDRIKDNQGVINLVNKYCTGTYEHLFKAGIMALEGKLGCFDKEEITDACRSTQDQ